MFAIIATGGKQYKVQEGDILYIEKLDAAAGDQVEINQVLAVSKNDGDIVVGNPVVEGAKAVLKVLGQVKDKKVVVFKYKAKKNYRRKQGHRQPHTKVQVEKIQA